MDHSAHNKSRHDVIEGAESDRTKRTRRTARIGLALVVILAVVSIVVLSGVEGVDGTLRATRWWGVAGALGCALLSVTAEGVLLGILIKDVRPRTIVRMMRAFLAGNFAGAMTPWALGGNPSWVWALMREGIGVGEAAAVITGRTVVVGGFFTLMGIAAAVMAPSISQIPQGVALSALVPVTAIILVISVMKRPERIAAGAAALLRWLRGRTGIERLDAAVVRVPDEVAQFAGTLTDVLSRRPLALTGAVLATAVSRFSQLSGLAILFFAQGQHVAFGDMYAGLIIVWVTASAMPAPSGEGVAQAVVASIFTPLTGAGVAAAGAIAWRALVYYPLFLAGGLLFARLVRGRTCLTEEPGCEAFDPEGAGG